MPTGWRSRERVGTGGIRGEATELAGEPGPSETPVRASCQSADRARPPSAACAGAKAAPERRHVTRRCCCWFPALARDLAGSESLWGPRREAWAPAPGSTFGNVPWVAVTKGPGNPDFLSLLETGVFPGREELGGAGRSASR